MSNGNTPLSAVGITRYHRPAEAYTKIRNDFARNAQVSLRAFRVASYILSHVDGFTQTQEQIARACGLSATTVRAALEDLRRDRYLVSRRLREGGRWIGTAYAISDIPFTDSELVELSSPSPDSVCSDSEHSESVPPKKIRSRRDTTPEEHKDPSGGDAAAAAPPSLDEESPTEQQEDAMPRRTEAPSLALFDVEKPPKAPESPSAKTVVAAYVDSFREHHSGGAPLRRDIGRVARDAKGILDSGAAGPDELADAAREMGAGPYSNLGMALKIHRDSGARRAGRQAGTAAKPHTDPYWKEVAERVESDWHDQLLIDDEAVAWVRQNPSEVDRLIQQWPDLAARLRGAA